MTVEPVSGFSQNTTHKNQNFEKLKSDINQLNEKNIDVGVIGKIRQLWGYISIKLGHRSSLKSLTHMSAEHMSQGQLAGGLICKVTPKIIDTLEKIQLENRQIISQLDYAKEISRIMYLPNVIDFFDFRGVAARVKNDISKLEKGQSLLIPSDCKGHAMTMSITCTEDINGKKKFSVVQYNEGLGLRYHYKKISEDGKLRYQTALEIKEVEGDQLYGSDSHFIKDIFDNLTGNVETLYESIIPQLNKKIEPPNEDERFWSVGQLGGSCSCACVLAFVRTQLSVDDYKEFQIFGKTECLLKLYRQIHRGCANPSLRKLVALEIVKELEGNDCIQGEKSSHLKGIKEKLGPQPTGELKSTPPVINPPIKKFQSIPEVINDNLNKAFKILKDSDFNHAAMEAARPIFNLILSLNPSANFTTKEYENFIKISSKISSYYQDRPLNTEQIYFMSVLSGIIKKFFSMLLNSPRNDIKELEDKSITKILDFTTKMFNHCHSLGLMSDSKLYNDLIESQSTMISEVELIGLEMQRMVDKIDRNIISSITSDLSKILGTDI
ncbi:MAG: hypothetical protein H0X29_10745 [Parachlamydiaceae bacterium]|nr:hypothetical protein [Parachlamydiaceae bacterium]